MNFSEQVFRLNEGDTEEVTLWANLFEKPAAEVEIPLVATTELFDDDPPTGVPARAIMFPSSVKTDNDGRATFTLRAAASPGSPRTYLDGQLYGIATNWNLDALRNPQVLANVHIYDTWTLGENVTPTWWQHIQPILNQYAVLYPSMRTDDGSTSRITETCRQKSGSSSKGCICHSTTRPTCQSPASSLAASCASSSNGSRRECQRDRSSSHSRREGLLQRKPMSPQVTARAPSPAANDVAIPALRERIQPQRPRLRRRV